MNFYPTKGGEIMPKCSLGSNSKNTDKRIRATIIYKQELNGVSMAELATYARISVSAMYQRMQKPENFRLRELRGICKRLDIDLTELIDGKEYV